MGSTDESSPNTGYEPKDCFLTETYVEFKQESMTEQRFPEQRFLNDVDYDDAAIGEMLCKAHREQVSHSQREGLSVGQSSSSVSDRTGQPVVETGQELNTEHAQIRTLLDRQRSKSSLIVRRRLENTNSRLIMTEEIYKLSETIESQQEELHRAQAEELHRRDQQLLHEQLVKQNWDLRQAHDLSLKEMEELKKFQSSTFDTIARRRLVEDQDTILEFTGKIQELQNEINCMNDSRDFQDAESVRSGNSHVTSRPVFFSHRPDPFGNAKPFYRNAEPQRRAAKHLGHTCYIGKRFCTSSCVFCSTSSAGIESMEFRKSRTDSLISGGEE